MRDILDSGILFRDYETSGLNSFYDQILTSSAKRYFNGQIVDEIYLTARCESHRLPSPFALFINGVTPAELENGLPLNSLIQLDHDFNNKYSRDFICCYNSNLTLIFPIAVISSSWLALIFISGKQSTNYYAVWSLLELYMLLI